MLAKVILLLADVLAIVCLTRCLLQWAKLPFKHPLAQFCCQTTDWLVKPLRKATPPLGRWDLACVLACVLVYYCAFTLVLLLALPDGLGVKTMAGNMFFTLLSLLKAAAYVLLLGLLLRMILSFRNPYAPLLVILHRIFEPLSSPFVYLRIGRCDFSGSILVLLLWFWLSVILPQLTSKLNLWLLG